MGCEVHLFAEIKIGCQTLFCGRGGVWTTYSQPRVVRNYALFEKMAGVRGEVSNAIAAPRGLPLDVSSTAKFCAEHDGRDAHNHSWLSASEIVTLCKWARENLQPHNARYMGEWDFEAETGCYFFGNSWEGFTLYPESRSRPKGIENVRFVFYFKG